MNSDIASNDYETRIELAYVATWLDGLSLERAARTYGIKLADLIEWLDD